MKKLYIVSLVILINLQFLYAQNINRKTSDLQINVNTESLEKSIQPQELLVEINKNIQVTPGFMSIVIENLESGLTLVSAKLNNEDLWLINSTASSTNEKVVAWNYDKENSSLIIYPYNWNSPYILDLNIQVNLKNISSIDSNTSTAIILATELGGSLFEALPTGRGNNIQIR
ncbi:MAG: hypothetical protein KAS18_01875 [Calditrichia bacterium]|nr:hypothetical protein [Calditrichia bacterium]